MFAGSEDVAFFVLDDHVFYFEEADRAHVAFDVFGEGLDGEVGVDVATSLGRRRRFY